MATCRNCGVRLSGHEGRCPSCGASVSASAFDSSEHLHQQITALLRQNRKIEAVKIYERVIHAEVPARDEAQKRIERIKKDNWLLFQQTEETDNVGIDV